MRHSGVKGVPGLLSGSGGSHGESVVADWLKKCVINLLSE